MKMKKCLNGAAIIALALLIASFASTGSASQSHLVGDSSGWGLSQQTNYTAWAMKETFYAGDELVFVYDATMDNVYEVDRRSYLHCTIDGTISHHQDGNTTIRLSRPGPHFYVCSTHGHCQQGQRFVAMVIPAPPPSSPSPTPPSGGTPTAPAPSTPPRRGHHPAPAPGGHHHRTHAPAPSPASNAFGVRSIHIGFLVACLATALIFS